MTAWICLGSNLEEPFKQLEKAVMYLSEKCYITILRQGKAMATKPFGFTDQPDFANQLIQIETPLSAMELLIFLKKVEEELGRKPTHKWGPRIIDMDILFYGDEVIKTDELTIPHPGIPEREYLLKLLNDIAPDYVHPEINARISNIYDKFQTTGGTQ